MSAPTAAPPRVVRALEGAAALALLLLAAIGAPFILKYRSEGAVLWGFSSRYLLGVVAPLALLDAGLAAMTLALWTGKNTLSFLPATVGRLPRWLGGAGALLLAVLSLVYAATISDEYVGTLAALLMPGCVILVWAVSFRGTAGANALMALLPVTALSILLFATELPVLMGGSPLVVWGDTTTFATMFPREPPFIGKGGRLRPNLDVRMRAPEYPTGARLVTNAEGFRSTRGFTPRPDAAVLRLLSLGDSFSTGFCADQDAFFGSLLEKDLAARRDTPVEVMSAEVSDPAYGLHYLQAWGAGYHPGLVIYGLSGNDMMQAEQFYGERRLFVMDAGGRLTPNPGFDPSLASAWDRYHDLVYPAVGRGGSMAGMAGMAGGGSLTAGVAHHLARFRLFSTLARAAATRDPAPADMPDYAESYERGDGHKRLIDGSANLGFFHRGTLEPVERMQAAAFDLIAGMDRASRESGARFLLVIWPQRYQVQPADWTAVVERWGLREQDFDLERANRRIASFCAQRGIACCDLLEPFRQAAPSGGLYLPAGDTHVSRRGHETAAAAAARCVERMLSGAPAVGPAGTVGGPRLPDPPSMRHNPATQNDPREPTPRPPSTGARANQ